jgi:hypothetical protein
MTFIMNEFEVDWAFDRFGADVDNLGRAVRTLDNLVQWTNRNSDGWPYWSKPSNASKRLQSLVHARMSPRCEDTTISDAEYKAALVPIKAFRTKHGADFEIEVPS